VHRRPNSGTRPDGDFRKIARKHKRRVKTRVGRTIHHDLTRERRKGVASWIIIVLGTIVMSTPRISGIELQDRRVEVQLNFRIEGVNRDVFVVLPMLEFTDAWLGNYGIGFYTSSTRIIAGKKQFAVWFAVRKPDSVSAQKPIGMVCDVEVSK